MPKRCKIEPSKTKEPRARPWKIELPASLSSTGKRQRFFFDTKQAANNFAEEQKTRKDNFGTQGLSGLSPSELEQAAKAFDDIKPFKVTLNEVIQEWIARRKARDVSVTFSLGYDQYLDHLKSKKVRGRHVSEEYAKQIRYTRDRVANLHKLHLSEITPKKVASEVEKFTPAMRNATLRVLSAFFGWCMETPREWLKDNPVSKIPKESLKRDEVQIYSPEEVQALLNSSPDDLKPFFLFGFFAGIRPQELKRVLWSHINLSERTILLPASVTKTASRRVIVVEPNLVEWLQWYQAKYGLKQGLVTPPTNLRKRLDAIRAGAKVKNIKDGMRHSYASYYIALHKDEHRIRENLGHRSADELWDHYVQATTEKEARVFWDIKPKGDV